MLPSTFRLLSSTFLNLTTKLAPGAGCWVLGRSMHACIPISRGLQIYIHLDILGVILIASIKFLWEAIKIKALIISLKCRTHLHNKNIITTKLVPDNIERDKDKSLNF